MPFMVSVTLTAIFFWWHKTKQFSADLQTYSATKLISTRQVHPNIAIIFLQINGRPAVHLMDRNDEYQQDFLGGAHSSLVMCVAPATVALMRRNKGSEIS